VTNRIALWIAIILALALLADYELNDGAAFVFLSRKFLDLVDWVVFWR
jgi:hypothetical protein